MVAPAGTDTPDTPEEPDPEDTDNHHEYVDLGLSVKWATCNIGANSPEEYGDYFAFGEVKPKSDYTWSNYKWCESSTYTLTKYCTESNYGIVDNKTVLDPEDDAAVVNWGGDWRMPTKEEQDELLEQCLWNWTSLNGVNGYNVVGPNGNSIFLPAAGCCYNGIRGDDAGRFGIYWSSALHEQYPEYGYALSFLKEEAYRYNWDPRYYGRSIRPVCQ